MLLQFTVIVLTSVAAAYAFQHTETTYQINGLCFYRYLAYAIAVPLGYICFSRYKKWVGLAFAFALSAIALSPIGHEAIELFPSIVPFLAVSMGVTTVLIVPSSRGKGFMEFLVVLILPAVLALSRIGGSYQLLDTTQSVSYYELSAITAVIVGGYLYLRYAALTKLGVLGLSSNGGDEKDVTEVNMWCNAITGLIVAGASGLAAVLMATASIVAEAVQTAVVPLQFYVLALTLSAGVAIAAVFYIFRFITKETRTHFTRRNIVR